MMESEKKRRIVERCLIVIVLGCIAAYLGMFTIINFRGFAQFCDSDMYSDTLIAKFMWEQKTLFPKNWIFGNQYYVVATPVLAALFYGVTENTNTAMVLATTVMVIFIFVSFFWLLRAMTKDLLLQLGCCLLLIASVIAPDGPFSLNAQLFFVMASFYACYLITMFVVFGDYVRAFQTDKPRIGTWVLCLLLSFATGMQSLRQTVIMVLPILACECFLALRRLLQKERAWSRENIGSLVRAVSYAIANFAGIAAIKQMPVTHASMYGDMKLVAADQLSQRLPSVWTAIREITALDYAFHPDYSPLFTVFCFFLLAVFLAAAVLWFSRIQTQESALELCWLLCLVGILGVCLSSVLFNVALRGIYLFMWYPLVAFSGLNLLKKLPFTPKCVGIFLACILSLGSLYHCYVPYAGMALWKGLSDAEQMCDWAMTEGYETVYGNWLVSPRVAVHSDGEMVAGYWWDPYTPMRYLYSTDIFDESNNENAIYVFTPNDEEACLRIAAERGVNMTLVAEFGDYKAYTSPVPLMTAPVPENN